MKKNMPLLFKVICLLFLFVAIFPQNVFAEGNEVKQAGAITVTGIVTDAKNEPLMGVTVGVKGAAGGTVTGLDGDYSIAVPNGNAILVFSYLGFAKQEVKVDQRKTINIVMTEDSEVLNEVVVVGYGVQKKINLTGSVSAINNSKLENRATANLSSSLTGLAPGMNITPKSGNPGSEEISIAIRGTGSFNGASPLVLVDGAVAEMNSVNPDDVESISILKDGASAAIYGSRAANGVILITTKRGKNDETPRVTYSNLFATQKAVGDWEPMSDMPTWMEWHNQAQLNTNVSSTLWYSQNMIDTWRAANSNPYGTDNGYGIPNWMAYPNTNWMDELYKSSFFQKHNLSVSGGSKNSNYLLSLGYQDNPGTFENTGQQRFNIRANVETVIADRITIGTQTYATKTQKDPGDTDLAYRYLTQAYPGMNPIIDGKYGASEDPNKANMNNPLRLIASKGGKNEQTTINTTWFARAKVWDGLTAEVRANYQNIFDEKRNYDKNVPSYRFRDGAETPVENVTTTSNATSYRQSGKTESYTLNFILNYNKTFGEHDLSAMAGYEQMEWKKSSFDAKKQGLLDWSANDITSTSTMYSIGGDAKINYAMISYFGRVNYGYKSRYLFEANFRTDGSSIYAPGHKWGYFPSFSGGWRISEESFYEPLKGIANDAKIRLSWGKLGNAVYNKSYYAWMALYGSYLGVMNESIANGLGMSQPANYDLTWESTSTTDVGLDLYMLDSRLGVTFDYYERKSSDILVKPAMPGVMGNITGSQWQNTASMTNKGIDLVLSWNDKIDKVRYGVTANINYNTNKVTKYRGNLEYGQMSGQYDIWGRPVYGYTNLGDASLVDGNTRTVEGHKYNEYYLNTVYKGSGAYYNTDGSVNPNGGPKDGMIRTKADLEWVKSMIAAGYSFAGRKVGTPQVDSNGNISGGSGSDLWYGDQILADENGDGIYGDSNDQKFTGKSAAPKWLLGMSFNAEWNGFDFNMSWDAKIGSYAYVNTTGVNGNISLDYDAINSKASSLYYQYDAIKSVTDYDNYDPATDPNANINAKYPRLLTVASSANANTLYLLNTSYLKLRTLQIGYTLPKKWTSAIGISNLRVFFSGENLLTIKSKDFVGLDPELGNKVTVYPLSRMYSGGFNLTF